MSTDQASITATEATVAGSSVAATEAEEDASFAAVEAEGADREKVILTKEPSLDISIAPEEKEEENEEEEGEYAAPMHLHALRTPAKLKGVRSRSSSRSRPGSRRNSTSPARSRPAAGELLGSTVSPSASVESSLDGIGDHQSHCSHGSDLDPDILLDKLGFTDLDPNVTHEQMQELLKKHMASNSSLPTLNERMSEETMDDVHAFQDLVPKRVKASVPKDEIAEGEGEDEGEDSPEGRRDSLKKAGMGLSSSAVMGSTSYLLGALNEVEEEEEGDLQDSELVLEIPDGIVPGGGGQQGRKKKNRDTMNTTMAITGVLDDEDEEEEDDDDAAAVGCAGSSFGSDSTDEGGDDDAEPHGEGEDIVVEIPKGVVHLGQGGQSKGKRRNTVSSTAAVASLKSISNDEVDEEEDAEVEVSTAVMNELKISSDDRKKNINRRDTSMAVAGSEMDYLEADEQDGLEADLASDDEEKPR